MSWRDQVQEGIATFRGVSFIVDVSTRAGGRAGVTHKYPFSEKAPYREDMGTDGDTFPIEGFVIGEEYITARDALIAELSKIGPGELVHPYHGTKKVAVLSWRAQDFRTEGGYSKITIEFEETSTAANPTSVPDAKARVPVSASVARLAIGAEFAAKFDALSNFQDSIAGAVQSATNTINSIVAPLGIAGQKLAALSSSVTELAASAANGISAPLEFVDVQVGVFQQLGESLLDTVSLEDPSGVLLNLYAFNPGVRPSADTPNAAVEQANFDATRRLTQRLVLVQAAEVAIEQTFASFEDAERIRTAIIDLIDEQAEIASDDTYPALQQLRTDLVNAIPGDAADLPRLLAHTPTMTVPSLVLAHRLYGDVSREAELVSRNKLRHPGFVTGGVPLEILSSE